MQKKLLSFIDCFKIGYHHVRVHDRSLSVAMHGMENSDEIRVTMIQGMFSLNYGETRALFLRNATFQAKHAFT